MNTSKFNELKQAISALSPKQKTDLEQHLLTPNPQPHVVRALELALDGCPHCQHADAYKWGTSKGRQRYRCKSCNKTYNAFTGSVLSSLKKPELWEQYCQTMVDSKSLRAAAKECGINLTTAFNWRHKFLKLNDSLMSKPLEGIAEMDETSSNTLQKAAVNEPLEKLGSAALTRPQR